MELDTLRDAFDCVVKRQKLSSSQSIEVVNQVEKEIEQAIAAIQETGRDGGAASDSSHASVLLDLKTKLREMAPTKQLETCQKEMSSTLSKWVKTVDKFFLPDISIAYRNVGMDSQLLNEIVSNHLYRDALFDIGDNFAREASFPAASSLKLLFQEMYRILGALKAGDLEPALSWAAKNHDKLLANGSVLELKLHKLQFVQILNRGDRDEALKYARAYLAQFATTHKAEIQKLITSILWAGRLEQSPYVEFLSPMPCGKMAQELTEQFCNLAGTSSGSPLSVAVSAGGEALPILLKLVAVLRFKDMRAVKQLPFPLDLRNEFHFHSVFICPVLREQGTDENLPVLLPCSHVLSKQSIVKLSKSNSRPFKCPYCPSEAVVSQCRQLHV